MRCFYRRRLFTDFLCSNPRVNVLRVLITKAKSPYFCNDTHPTLVNVPEDFYRYVLGELCTLSLQFSACFGLLRAADAESYKTFLRCFTPF